MIEMKEMMMAVVPIRSPRHMKVVPTHNPLYISSNIANDFKISFLFPIGPYIISAKNKK
jgi:hypothetical protein